jgi:hypothetical protein
MNPEAGAAGIAAMLPGVAVNGELKSEIEALRNEVSELKGMIKKLLKKVAEEHDDDDSDSDEKGDK